MDFFTRAILNSAQPTYDGGVIADIFRHVDLFNNSRVKEEAMRYVLSVRITGGYLAGVLCGVLWVLGLVATVTVCCWRDCRCPRKKVARGRLFRGPLVVAARGGGPGLWPLAGLLAVAVSVLVLLGLSTATIVSLARTISLPSDDPGGPATAILPGLQRSLASTRVFLTGMADAARRDTKETVEEIVVATKEMQEVTSNRFNGLLMERLGVAATLRLGGQMANIVASFFDLAEGLEDTRMKYEAVMALLYPPDMDPATGLFRLLARIREAARTQLASCEGDCQAAAAFFDKKFVVDRTFANTDFARSFLFVMQKRNETRASVLAKSEHGRRQQARMVARTKQRMAEMVDIGATVRNATAAGWDKMQLQMAAAVAKLDNVSAKLASKKTAAAASRVSALISVALLVPVLLAGLALVLVLLLAFDGARDRRLRLLTVVSYGLLGVCVLYATGTFLAGGTAETEWCRYLRTSQPVVVGPNGTRMLALDSHINRFLAAALPRIKRSAPRMDFPLPHPRNPLYGLLHRCRDDEPLLVALDAIASLDTRGLTRPETSAPILAVGRMLLLESLNASDPRAMMPADMQDSLKQAAQMDMFKKISIEDSLALIPRSPIRERRGNQTVTVSVALFTERVDKFLETYGPIFRDEGALAALKEEYASVLRLLERAGLLADRARDLFRGMRLMPDIGPVVRDLQRALEAMIATMADKKALFRVAEDFYERHVVASTPANSARVMAKFGPRMFAKLARCRPLFEAYAATVDTGCDLLLPRLNGFWLYLGSALLLVTLLAASVCLAVARAGLPPAPSRDDLALKQPLAGAPPPQDPLDPVKTVL